MRTLLLLLAALAAAGLAVLAWTMLGAAPPGGGAQRSGDPRGAREARDVDGALAGLRAEEEALAAPEVSLLPGGDERAAAVVDAERVGQHAAYVLAISGPEDEPVAALSVGRSRLAGERLRVPPELSATERPGVFEVRWPATAASLDLVLEADGLMSCAVGALAPGEIDEPRVARFVRPASLAVHLTGYPAVEGAHVELFPRRDARRGSFAADLPWTGDGPVVFEGLRAGLASVAAVVPGAPPAHLAGIRLREGARTVVEIEAPRGEEVRGTIVEVGTERPLAGVRVQLQPLVSGLADREERAPFDAVVTGANGRFSFDGAPVGKARALLTTADGVRVNRDFVIIEGNGAREIKLRVQPSASLAGRVIGRAEDREGLELAVVAKGDAGQVIGGALSGRPLARRSGVAVEIQPDGTFLAEQVPAGRELLVVARHGKTGALSSLEVLPPLSPGERREGAELALRTPPVRQFSVTDRGDRPIESVVVRFEERLAGATAWTDGVPLESPSGSYELTGRAQGARRIRVDAEGYTSVVAGWNEGEAPVLRMRGRRDVHVVVLSREGTTLSRARVRAVAEVHQEPGKKRRGGPQARDGCDRYGRANLDLDPEYRWRLTVEADGHEAAGPFFVDRADDLPFDAPLVVRLEPEEAPELGVVRGEIVRFGSGGPIFDLDFDGLRGGTWRVDGTAFELRGLRPGRFDIKARSGGFETVRVPVESLEPGQEVDVGVLRARPATQVEVRVVDHRGRRQRGHRVRLLRLPANRGGRDDLPRRVDLPEDRRRRGSYAAKGVGRAKWRLTVEQGRKRVHSRIVTLKEARQLIQVKLAAPGDGGG